jgi:hypothetical protein
VGHVPKGPSDRCTDRISSKSLLNR